MYERMLRVLVLLVLTVLLVGYWVTHPGSLISYTLVGAAVGFVLLLKPAVILQGALLTGAMELLLPGFGGTLGLQHFFFALLLAYGVLRGSLEKGHRLPASARFLLGFGLVLLLIVSIRGIGFRAFGSQAFGGSDYVKVFLAIGGYWGGLKIQLSPSQVRRTLILYALAPLVPLLAQTLISIHPQAFGALSRVIETRAQYILSEESLYGFRGVAGGVGGRLHAAGALASGVWMLLWLRFGLRDGSVRWILYVGLVGAVTIASLSGFRGTTAGVAAFGGLCLWLTSRRKALLAGVGAGLVFVALVVMMAVGPRLPLNVQRAFSFVPWIRWDPAVRRDAANSLNWRLELWRHAARYVPRYLVIGRGLLLEDVYQQHAWRSWEYYSTPEFFYATHSYHSGPLSLILDTGVAGLLLFMAFQVSVVRESWKGWSRAKARSSDAMLRAAMFFYALRTTYQLVGYYLLYGDIKYNVVDWVVAGLLIHSIARTVRATAVAADARLSGEETRAQWAVPPPLVPDTLHPRVETTATSR